MGKWFSRKFFVFLLVFFVATYLKFLNKLGDMYYTIIILCVSVVYLFINAEVKIKAIKWSDGRNTIDIAENTEKNLTNN